MNSESDILKALEPIFCSVFHLNSIQLSMTTSANEIRNWDSMHHVSLMADIETHFGFEFDFDDLISIQNVGDIVRVVLRIKGSL